VWFNYMIEAFHVITCSHSITLTQILKEKKLERYGGCRPVWLIIYTIAHLDVLTSEIDNS
jgi:hypothetical protein